MNNKIDIFGKGTKKQKYLNSCRQKAMPEVKKLCKKFSRNIIIWCLNQMHEYDKKVKKIAELRREAEKLERAIK